MTRGLCLAFDRRRIIPLLATYESQGDVGLELAQAGVASFVVPKQGKFSLGLPQALRRIVRQERIDAVLSMHEGVNFFNLLATCNMPRVAKLIRLARVGMPWKILLTEGLISWLADRLICNSQAGIDAVSGRYTIPQQRCLVIPNGCDTQRFSLAPPECRIELRAALGLPQDAFVLYTPNRIHEFKGQDILAAALARIPALLKAHNVLWVNTGLIQHEAIAQRIHEHAAEIEQHVRLLPPTAEPEKWIAASDAVVIPSRTESFPNVLLEASAVGRPVLTTSCGAAATVGPQLGALVVEPDSVDGLVRGLTDLLAMDEASRADRGRAASRIVQERYTIEAVAAQYAEAIESAVTQRRGAQAAK